MKKDPRNIEIGKTLKYMWQFYSDSKWLFFLTNFFQSITVLLGFFISPIFFKKLLDTITEFSGDNRTEIWTEITDFWFIILIIDIIAFWVFARLADYSLAILDCRGVKNLNNFCFSKILEHSSEFFANNFVGSLVSKFGRFNRALNSIVELFCFNFLPTFLRFIAAVGIIFYFSPKIALILFVWIIIFFGILIFFILKYRLPTDLKCAKLDSKISGKSADIFSNILPVKMFARDNYEISKFKSLNFENFISRKKAWITWANINVFQSFMIMALGSSTLYLMLRMWTFGEISIGTIVMIQAFLGQIYMNLWGLGGHIQTFLKNIADSAEMIKLLEAPIGIADPKNPEKCKIAKGKIEFRNVGFQYNEGIDIFKNFNLTIRSGERIGLVGESGAGKSTFVNLLLRFSDLSDGQLCIDGQDISKITQNDLRTNIAYVPQEPVLFHRSLFENIKYGDINATEEEIYQAAKNAHAMDFIQKSPEKWKTLVGERGVKLSGGEKQRIAIARAMLKNSPILILDEATSALDSKAEILIQKALHKLMTNRTTIVIAHRLSTLREMNRIIVLDNGKIVEEGSHDELIKNKGKYAELWGHQIGGFIG